MSRHTITAHFNDEYEDSRHALKVIQEIRERTHQSYGRILTDIVNRHSDNSRRLGQEEISVIATAIAKQLLEKLPEAISVQHCNSPAASEGEDIPREVEVANMSLPGTPEDDDLDFSESNMDFSFIGF